jgi:hypothetical protein
MSMNGNWTSGGSSGNAASATASITVNGAQVSGTGYASGAQVHPPAEKAICAYRGHEIGGELVHYLDGKIVGRCTDCDARVVIDWFPGGTAVAQVKGMVAAIMGADEVTEEMVENFHRAAELLEEDAEAIEDARDLIKITKAVVARRLREN